MKSKEHGEYGLVARTRADASRLIRTRFWIAVAMLGAVLVTFVVMTMAMIWQIESSLRAAAIARVASRTQATAVDRLASIRAFMISGDSANLQMELSGRKILPARLDTLGLVLRRDTTALEILDRIRGAVAAWESGFATPMLSRSQVEALTVGDEQLAGKAQFDAVRAAFASLGSHLGGQIRQAEGRARTLLYSQFAAIAGQLLVVLLVMVRFRRLILAKASVLEEQQERMEEQAMELEQQQAELEATNEELSNSAVEAEEQRDQAEHALRELTVQTALLSATMNSAPIGFSFFDRDLRFTLVNRTIADLRAVPPSYFVGKTVDEIIPARADFVNSKLRQVLETGQPILDTASETESAAHGGEKRHLLTSYFPIMSERGEVLGVGAVSADMSDQRRLENELRQSQKMDAIGQLAGGIAHDFNNLLTVIVGHSEMLLSQLNDPASVDDTRQIQRAAAQAAALTQKLLAFSRKQVLLPRVIDLGATVKDLMPMLRRLIREDIEIELNVPGTSCKVKADPTQVEQVLLNLAVNARDAMPRGGRLVIEIESAHLDEEYLRMHGVETNPGVFVVLVVRDNGVGMDENVRKRAFEPFFTTKETGKGTGLGLATVYGIVKQSGGHIWLYSEKGLGTTFKIYIPAFDGAMPASTTQSQQIAGAMAGETVLLVEDDPAVLALAKRVLESLRYRVITATNGKEALLTFAVHTGEIRAIVTDVVMPGMSGGELVREIQQSSPDIPVVFMSGYTGDDMTERGMLDSDSVFVQKPFTTQALASAVRTALEGARKVS